MKHRTSGKLNRWLLTGCILLAGEMHPFLLEGKDNGPPVSQKAEASEKETPSINEQDGSEKDPGISLLATKQEIGGLILQLQADNNTDLSGFTFGFYYDSACTKEIARVNTDSNGKTQPFVHPGMFILNTYAFYGNREHEVFVSFEDQDGALKDITRWGLSDAAISSFHNEYNDYHFTEPVWCKVLDSPSGIELDRSPFEIEMDMILDPNQPFGNPEISEPINKDSQLQGNTKRDIAWTYYYIFSPQSPDAGSIHQTIHIPVKTPLQGVKADLLIQIEADQNPDNIPLSKARFLLEKTDDPQGASWILQSNENGEVHFSPEYAQSDSSPFEKDNDGNYLLNEGVYQISQLDPPDGFRINEEIRQFVVDKESEVLETIIWPQSIQHLQVQVQQKEEDFYFDSFSIRHGFSTELEGLNQDDAFEKQDTNNKIIEYFGLADGYHRIDLDDLDGYQTSKPFFIAADNYGLKQAEENEQAIFESDHPQRLVFELEPKPYDLRLVLEGKFNGTFSIRDQDQTSEPDKSQAAETDSLLFSGLIPGKIYTISNNDGENRENFTLLVHSVPANDLFEISIDGKSVEPDEEISVSGLYDKPLITYVLKKEKTLREPLPDTGGAGWRYLTFAISLLLLSFFLLESRKKKISQNTH